MHVVHKQTYDDDSGYVVIRGSEVYDLRRPSLVVMEAGMQYTGSISCSPG